MEPAHNLKRVEIRNLIIKKEILGWLSTFAPPCTRREGKEFLRKGGICGSIFATSPTSKCNYLEMCGGFARGKRIGPLSKKRRGESIR